MAEEKNSLLGYLQSPPGDEKRVFVREVDDSKQIHEFTYEELAKSVFHLGQFIREKPALGHHIPLFLDTSFPFLQAFLGILAAKKVCVPIHTIANIDTIEFILRKVKASCLFVTNLDLYKKLVSVDYVHKHIHTIFASKEIIAQKSLPSQHIDIEEIFAQQCSYQEAIAAINTIAQQTNPDEPMEIVFTSGTTGEPKGAVLSHRNVVSCVVRAANHLKVDATARSLTFLPLSHVMAQNEVFIGLIGRAVIQMVPRDHLLYGLKTLKPNMIVSVPRVYQAIHQGICRKMRSKPKVKKLLDFSVDMTTRSKRGFIGLRLLCQLYSKTIGRLITYPIRKNLGKFQLMVTAGAACPEHIYYFFETIGLPLTNAQGLTEVSGAVMYNQKGKTIGTSVGYPLQGVEVKIDEDGEILMKGDPVFSGYFEEPEANEQAFTPDGWFRTGDLGRVEKIHNKEYLFLEGRKKEIVVLASGINVPPSQIEEKLLQHDLIHQVVVLGDGKPRLGALIVPEDGQNNSNLREEISKIIRNVNAQMDANEKIGSFEILSEPFTVENGMLTPTLKVRRPVVFQHYKDVISQLYNTPA